MMIIEVCPQCEGEINLEVITNEEGYVIDWICPQCKRHFTLEDLKMEPIQKDLGEWLK